MARKIKADVSGRTLYVKRVDYISSWDEHLVLKATCHEPVYDIHVGPIENNTMGVQLDYLNMKVNPTPMNK